MMDTDTTHSSSVSKEECTCGCKDGACVCENCTNMECDCGTCKVKIEKPVEAPAA